MVPSQKEIIRERKKQLKKLIESSGIDIDDAGKFLTRLKKHEFFDGQWRMLPEEFESVGALKIDKEKPILSELSKLEKDVIGLINTYPGSTQKIILLAFKDNIEYKIEKAIKSLIDDNLIFEQDSKFYPTLTSKQS